MAALKMIKGVKRITILGQNTSGDQSAVQVYKVKRKSKKGTRGLRGIEKAARRVLTAQNTQVSDYLDRHKRSNGKRRDGWLRDAAVNVVRSHRKGMKKLKLNRWL
jgi:hypothetical protein